VAGIWRAAPRSGREKRSWRGQERRADGVASRVRAKASNIVSRRSGGRRAAQNGGGIFGASRMLAHGAGRRRRGAGGEWRIGGESGGDKAENDGGRVSANEGIGIGGTAAYRQRGVKRHNAARRAQHQRKRGIALPLACA